MDNHYNGVRANNQSQLARFLFTEQLAKRLVNSGVTVYSVNPGLVKTDIFKHISNKFGYKILNFLWYLGEQMLTTPNVGSQTVVYCAVEEQIASESGLFYE